MSVPSTVNALYDFLGKWRGLKQAGKEAKSVLNTLAGNAWATLSVCIGQQKARGAPNGPT